jgi:hypothetical protein
MKEVMKVTKIAKEVFSIKIEFTRFSKLKFDQEQAHEQAHSSSRLSKLKHHLRTL